MNNLSPTDRFCYRIAYQPSAIVPLAEVPAVLQLPEAEAASVLAELIAGGHLDLWPERRAVVLSASAAQRLDLELAPDRRHRLQWHQRGSRAAERRHRAASCAEINSTRDGRPAVIRECDLRDADADAVLDDLPGPTSVELADQGVPRLILGAGMVWPVRHAKGEKCRGCRHLAKLPTGAVCVLCHRAGVWNLRAVRPDDVGNPDVAPVNPPPSRKPKGIGSIEATPRGLMPRPAPALAGGIGRRDS